MTRIAIRFHSGFQLVYVSQHTGASRGVLRPPKRALYSRCSYMWEKTTWVEGTDMFIQMHALTLSRGSFSCDADPTDIFHPQQLWHLLLDFVKFISL